MEVVKTVLLIYFVALFSATLLPKMDVFYMLPNLILIFSLLFIFQKEFKKGLLWACLGGLFTDFLYNEFPSNIFITAAITLLCWFLIQRFLESSNVYLFLAFCFSTSLIYNFLLFPTLRFSFMTTYFSSALYSSLLGLIFYLIYRHFQKRLKKSLI